MTFTTRPEIVGTFGVAASTHWLASQTAMGVLERGGNAFDAAVAGGFVLQVVEPHLNGPGGEVPILFWDEARAACHAPSAAKGTAPAEATAHAFQRMGLEQVPGIGLLPATVPGAFGAWLTLLRDHGTWSLADVLAPAIGYARDGFPLIPRAVQAIHRGAGSVSHTLAFVGRRLAARRPRAAARRAVSPAEAGRNLGAAARRSEPRRRQPRADHRCRTALLVSGVSSPPRSTATTAPPPSSTPPANRNNGLLRYDDMAQWRPTVEAPLTLDFGRYTVAKCGFWSQGPAFLQQLGMLRHAGLEQHAPHTRRLRAPRSPRPPSWRWPIGSPGTAPRPAADPAAQRALLSDDYLRAALAAGVGPRRHAASARHAARPIAACAGPRRCAPHACCTPTRASASASRRLPRCRRCPNGPSAKSSSATPATST